MSRFAVLLTPRAMRKLDQARADGRTLDLDEEVAEAFRQLEALPQTGVRHARKGAVNRAVRLDTEAEETAACPEVSCRLGVSCAVWPHKVDDASSRCHGGNPRGRRRSAR